VFGKQWAHRFWNRNNFSSRSPTTKTRESIPEDYEKKRNDYLFILSKVLSDARIPDELIVGFDETNTQFVPTIGRTRAKKGTKRVRMVGVGKNKAQITVGIGVVATGEVLKPVQLIFGGKTERSLPKKKTPQSGQIWHVTDSHWQNPKSFMKAIDEIFVPYRKSMVAKLQLPSDQKMCLLLDLHYSHFEEEVLNLLKEHFIVPVFIPAGCTDLHQVLDVVVNKPYKDGVTEEFISYLNRVHAVQYSSPNWNGVLHLNLNSSFMKPLIPHLVANGVKHIATVDMQETIRNSFKEHALVEEARSQVVIEEANNALRDDFDSSKLDLKYGIEETVDVTVCYDDDEEFDNIDSKVDDEVYEYPLLDSSFIEDDAGYADDDDSELEGEVQEPCITNRSTVHISNTEEITNCDISCYNGDIVLNNVRVIRGSKIVAKRIWWRSRWNIGNRKSIG
jgi:hypothetical protein